MLVHPVLEESALAGGMLTTNSPIIKNPRNKVGMPFLPNVALIPELTNKDDLFWFWITDVVLSAMLQQTVSYIDRGRGTTDS